MQAEVMALLRLQVIDYDLGELERSKEYLPDMMDNLQREIIDARERFERATADLEAARIRQKHLELEIATREAGLQKFQQQMMSIKTNKEYDALVAEIDGVKSAINKHETELLETMEVVKTLESSIVEFRERAVQIKENNEKQLSILKEKIESIGDKVQGKQVEREQLLVDVPRRIMSVYDRVRRGKGGAAIVAVKNRACSGCFKQLTPKKIQDIRRADGIFTCDNCGRLLFWEDDD